MLNGIELPAGFTAEETEGGFTLTARLSCPMSQARCLAVTAASWVRAAAGGEAKIQWPNHVVADGKRICAIKCLALADGGLRFTFLPALEAELPADFPAAVCRAAVKDLADYPDDRPQLIQRYCEHCMTVMKFVDTTYHGVPLYGFAFAVDKHGGLMVMTQESHTVVTLYGGEAVVVGKRDQEPPELPPTPRL